MSYSRDRLIIIIIIHKRNFVHQLIRQNYVQLQLKTNHAHFMYAILKSMTYYDICISLLCLFINS